MTINQLTGTECGTEIAKIINRLISEKSDTDLGNLSAIGQAILDGKSSISLDNLSAAGQAILDKKVEVEALLQQNGYAKFTWKENNQISNLIIQWGVAYNNAVSATLPIMYTTQNLFTMAIGYQCGGSMNFIIDNLSMDTFTITPWSYGGGDWSFLWFSIGN